ncbi:MAG: LemA family protein [Mycoplasmoidaceae bacterium]|nr:LemA family protein [Mycoplasmoidaceae bacterium]
MANELDEKTGPINEQGRDVNVIDKQLEIKTGAGTIIFIVLLFILGLIPGLIWLIVKQNRQSHLDGLQQKIQSNASKIDNYLVQKGDILRNAADLLGKAVSIDKSVFTEIAKARSGVVDGNHLSKKNENLDKIQKKVQVAFEQYPELKSHQAIADCMQQSSYLTREITAARDLYNDTVLEWNREIYK